jgi:Domain of unknown function (DUF4177)
MTQWEYKVVSFQDGRYTEALNAYGRDGWELVDVAPDVHVVAGREGGWNVPMPRAFGRLEDVAAKLSEADPKESAAPEPGTIVTRLIWVLRRPLAEADSPD